MADWRDLIIADFTPELSRLTLVADPDGLLTDEKIQVAIQSRGFELIPFDDPVAFRYAYETKFRRIWDSGETTELVVALRSEADSLQELPFDLLHTGRRIGYRLTEIFPNLSYPVVKLLQPDQLDKLYRAQEVHGGNVLGERGTMDFVLDHVFDFLPRQTWQSPDLLRCLLRHHYAQVELPDTLTTRVIHILESVSTFKGWPLKAMVSSRAGFVDFLQEAWPRFLRNRAAVSVAEDSPGTPDLPLDHGDVRVYLDNYFAEGLLKPVELDADPFPQSDWVRIGIKQNPAENFARRFEKLAGQLTKMLPEPDAQSNEWLVFAARWADFEDLITEAERSSIVFSRDQTGGLHSEVEQAFQAWMMLRYDTLASKAPSPPVMVHHIARHLARVREQTGKPVALIVIDGITICQWRQISGALPMEAWQVSERAVFAWAPTLTPISRQAIFAGKPPCFFPTSISTTSKEPAHWRSFWSDHGIADGQSFFLKLTSGSESEPLENQLPDLATVRAVGIVLTALDEVVHGIVLGKQQLTSSVQVWNNSGNLAALLERLLSAGFHVAVTSDHGNLPAWGIGAPKEGLLAETRGERVRIYSDTAFQQQMGAAFPSAVSWTPHGLPESCHPLFASGNDAFISKGESRICHGGISLEEVIVPFVEIHKEGR